MKKLVVAGLLLFGLISLSSSQTVTWTKCTAGLTAGKSFPSGITGCSGVRANRLTGEVYIDCIENGIWKSSDKGQNWTRIDQNTVGGRNETGWGLEQDQEHPGRLANFSLDGNAGWTIDGTTWKTMAHSPWGRNWDYGSVDWASANPKTIFASAHESQGLLYVSTDGAATTSTWKLLSVKIDPGSALATPGMVGVLDSTTLIYGNGHNGIQRSTDLGTSWSQVSTINPQSRVSVLFKGVHYLCASSGLLVSKNKGATWQAQGASVNIFQGPFFGGSEDTMVTVGNQGIYYSANAGTTWTRLAANLVPAFGADQANYWATFTWDPVNHCCYATRMGNDGYRADLVATSVAGEHKIGNEIEGFSIVNSTIHSALAFDGLEVFTINGALLYQWHGSPMFSFVIPSLAGGARSSLVCRVTSSDGSAYRSKLSPVK
jgi:hypothetical protein